MDIGTKQELYRQLTAFSRRGGAIVYLSSEIEEFFDFADRVAVFVNMSLHRTVPAAEVGEASLLAALFGIPVDAPVPAAAGGGRAERGPRHPRARGQVAAGRVRRRAPR